MTQGGVKNEGFRRCVVRDAGGERRGEEKHRKGEIRGEKKYRGIVKVIHPRS